MDEVRFEQVVFGAQGWPLLQINSSDCILLLFVVVFDKITFYLAGSTDTPISIYTIEYITMTKCVGV